MTDELFDIYFSGKVLPDHDLDTVKQTVGKLFNANAAVLEQLFSGKPVKIKKSVDMDTAIRYRVKFRDAGAIVDIRPTAAPAAQASPASSPQPPQPVKPAAEPVATASKADDTPPPDSNPHQPAPSALETSLAAAGSIIDETPEPPPAQINTDELILGPANQGSLEEFAETVQPAPIPDISALDVSSSEEPLDTTPPPAPLDVDTSGMMIDSFAETLDDTMPPPPANIDTSGLSASEPNSGSLEAFNTRPEPVPLPDISKLEVEK